jgi:hypothetical protein
MSEFSGGLAASLATAAMVLAVGGAARAAPQPVTTDIVSFTMPAGAAVNYTAYPSPGIFETFVQIPFQYPEPQGSISALNPDLFSSSTINVIGSQPITFSVNNVDSSPGWTGADHGLLENLGGSGAFSITLPNLPVGQQNLLSGSVSGGWIWGDVGGATAEIVLNISDLSSNFATNLPATQYLVVYGDVSPAVSVGDNYSTCFGVGCLQYINSFTLDYGVDVSPTAPGSPGSAAPEPSSWALMIGGLAGLGAVIRRRPLALT